MGTSASSKGPGGGVPMVPPWVPDAVPPNPALAPEGDGLDGPSPTVPNQPAPPRTLLPQPSPIAPASRFGGTRTNLGRFASSGDGHYMRRGLREYVRKGYGGRDTATRRFGGTASTAGALYGALSNVAGGQPAAPGSPLDPAILAGRSAREVKIGR